jgi:hypothetical protein
MWEVRLSQLLCPGERKCEAGCAPKTEHFLRTEKFPDPDRDSNRKCPSQCSYYTGWARPAHKETDFVNINIVFWFRSFIWKRISQSRHFLLSSQLSFLQTGKIKLMAPHYLVCMCICAYVCFYMCVCLCVVPSVISSSVRFLTTSPIFTKITMKNTPLHHSHILSF